MALQRAPRMASQMDALKAVRRASLKAPQMVPRMGVQMGAPRAALRVALTVVPTAAPKGTQTESCSAGSSAASPRHTNRSVSRWIRNRHGPEHTTGMRPASSRQQRTTGSLKYQGTSTGQQDTPNRTPRRPPTLCPWDTHSQNQNLREKRIQRDSPCNLPTMLRNRYRRDRAGTPPCQTHHRCRRDISHTHSTAWQCRWDTTQRLWAAQTAARRVALTAP